MQLQEVCGVGGLGAMLPFLVVAISSVAATIGIVFYEYKKSKLKAGSNETTAIAGDNAQTA